MGEDNSRKEEEEEERNLVTRPSNQTTTINKHEKVLTSIYVFGRKVSLWIPQELWNSFKQIAKVEGLSASKLAEKALIEYFKSHSRPNPQLLMPYYLPELEEPQPLRVLCIHCQGALTDGRVFCEKRGGMWIPSIQCYSCKHNRLRK
jgi:hypothetical protein